MNFLDYVQNYCLENNIDLVVSEKSRVNCYSIESNGFFDPEIPKSITKDHVLGLKKFHLNESGEETKMMLAYSLGGKTEEEILGLVAHEFGHANQYLETSKLWVESDKFLIWDKYFTNEKTKYSKVLGVWKRIVQLEADCEKRVINFIEQFNLDINKEKYAQKANAYLYFYMFALKKRKWYNRAPYEIEDIVSSMPKKIMELDFYSDEENKEILSKEKMFDQCFV